MNRVRISPEWRAGMETRCEDRAGQQVQCLTSEPGSMWIHGLDDLPDAVRARLARSKYNLCPVCVAAEADAAGSGRPSVAIYFAVIAAIEQAISASEAEQPGGGDA